MYNKAISIIKGEYMADNYTVSLRLNDEENTLIRTYAEIKGISVSEFLRESALESIKMELDVLSFKEAYAIHLKKPNTMDAEKLRVMLGIV
jgi:RHH-type transcriptional regulator, rel operon repressor / antitoxin RelB